MTKTQKIVYWVATIWLSLGMLSTGAIQLLKVKAEVDFIKQMGYPAYLLTIIGTWKILGVIVVLVPKFPLLKEWAYAGFFFVMSGAIISHAATGYMDKVGGAALLLVLTVLSWYFRPADRKIVSANA